MNIKRTLKRLIDDTQYVAALEKQNDLLKENLQQEKDNLQKQKEDFRKEKEQKVADEEAQYKKRRGHKTKRIFKRKPENGGRT